MSFFIKDIEIKKNVILAPMAGITSFSYRKFMNEFHPGLTYTEMISDFALIYHNKKTFDMLYTDGSDRPLAVQLFGGSKETILKSIDVLKELNINYDILDLNLACPVPKVTKNNSGSKWLIRKEELFDMVQAVVRKSEKPVSAKIRLGYDDVNVDEIAPLLEKAGISFLAIHARTKKELYLGKPHFDLLKNIRDEIKIPFCVSGNIYTVEDALNALKITRANAVMVARGGIGNPLLIENINRAIEGRNDFIETNFNRQAEYLYRFIDLLIKEKGEKAAFSILKGIAPKFFLNLDLPNVKNLRSSLSRDINSLSKAKEIIENYKIENLLKL